MDVLMVTAFVSMILVIGGVLLYVMRVRAGDFEHGDRLSLLPLQDDEGAEQGSSSTCAESTHPPTGGSA